MNAEAAIAALREVIERAESVIVGRELRPGMPPALRRASWPLKLRRANAVQGTWEPPEQCQPKDKRRLIR